jgi:hypothetical protein
MWRIRAIKRGRITMHRLGVWLFLCGMLVGSTFAAPQANAYTQQEANACMPDAFRLCGAAIPDADRVGKCLFENKRKLSAACAAVFSRPRSASTRGPAVQKTGF